MLAMLALAALTADLPNGKLLTEGDRCFSIKTTKGDAEQIIGNVLQTVRRRRSGGVETLAIVVHQRLANGKFDMCDKFIVMRTDLRPIQMDNFRNGAPHVHLEYSATKVAGWKVEEGIRQPLAVKLTQPVWEGNLWGLTFAALPLRVGGRYTLQTFHYDKGLGEFGVEVKGKERVHVGQTAVDAWVLEAGVHKDQRSEYLISLDRDELGYRAGAMSQSQGGDCASLRRP